MALERQVLEVFELFKVLVCSCACLGLSACSDCCAMVQDLATLVDLQQESLDVIETRIQNSKAYVESGEKELKQAEEYQRKSRKVTGCCAWMYSADHGCGALRRNNA